MKNQKLFVQIMLIGVVSLIGFAVVGGVYMFTANKAAQYAAEQNRASEAYNVINDVRYEFLNARRSEKDFLIRLNEKYMGKHAKNVENVNKDLEALRGFSTDETYQANIDAVKQGFDV